MDSDSLVEYSIDNIIIGNSFKMIESKKIINNKVEKKIFYNVKDKNSIYEKDTSGVFSENLNLNYSYFMKNNEYVNFNTSYDQDFLNKIQENEDDNNKNLLFFDKVINNLSGLNYIQIKNKYYFLNLNEFNDNQMISGKYENLSSSSSLHDKVLNKIKNHVSLNYNNTFYNNSLIFVNDKSVPIYDLNYSALDKIDVLKFQDQNIVNSIINHIDSIINLKNKKNGSNFKKISELQEKILYDSKLNKKSTINYDSIIIMPIMEEYFNNKEILNEIFDYLFINLSFESFLRLLIPIGKINTVNSIFNETNENIENNNENKVYKKINTTDIENYIYYINVDNIENLSKEIEFNYFYLKNFKNPHNEFNYSIYDINSNLTCYSNSYNFKNSILYKFLIFFNKSLKDLANYLKSSHFILLSSQFIEDNNLINELINFTKKKYTNWSDEVILSSLNFEDSWLRNKIFNNYFKETYNKNLEDEPYLIYYNDVISYWNLKMKDYENEFKNDFYDDDLLSSYYLSGLTICNEVLTSLNNNISLYNDFIKKDLVSNINKNYLSLSNTLNSLYNLYKPSLNKFLALDILNKNNIIDKNLADNYEWYREKYKNRFSIKINDYLSYFNNYFKNENIMKKDGFLYGYRKYKFINKSFTDKLFITYNYFTSYDYNFLERHQLLDVIKIKDQTNSLYNVTYDFKDINENTLFDVKSFKVNLNQVCECEDLESQNKLSSYLAMLLETDKYEFIDLIKGGFKYKENEISKSNVYSIELKNSFLNYDLINYDEMLAFINKNIEDVNYKLNELNKPIISGYENYEPEIFELEGFLYYKDEENNFKNNLSASFLDIIHLLGYNEILDITNNDDIELLKKTSLKIPSKLYKFYNKNNSLNENINLKMECRKQLEKAIRKSISRYAPVNTVLWDIKYTGY